MSISFYDYCLKYNMHHLLEEWDYERNDKRPQDISSKSAYKAWWKCKDGHNWSSKVCIRSNGSNCPKCGTLQVHLEQNICKDYEKSLAYNYPYLAEEWDNELNTRGPDTYFPYSRSKVYWKCPKGHSYSMMIQSRVAKNCGCNICARGTQMSKAEVALYFYIKQVFTDTILDYKIDNQKFDMYIPSLDTLLEYDGAYFHRDRYYKDAEKANFCLIKHKKLIRFREPGLPEVPNCINILLSTKDYYKVIPEALYKLGKLLNIEFKIDLIRDQRDIFNTVPSLKGKTSIKDNKYLMKYYAIELNPDASTLTPSTHIKVWWFCDKGHLYLQDVSNKYRGQGCPYCSTNVNNKTIKFITLGVINNIYCFLDVDKHTIFSASYEEIYKFWTQHRIYPLGLKMQDNRLYLDFEAIKIRGTARYDIDALIGPEDTSTLSLEIYKYLKVISHFNYYKTKYYRDLLFTDTISALENLRNYM